jgi:hypothetical protein
VVLGVKELAERRRKAYVKYTENKTHEEYSIRIEVNSRIRKIK